MELYNQRAREFWLEGRRISDMQRNLAATNYLPVAGSVYIKPGYPNVGNQTCWILPFTETSTNPEFRDVSVTRSDRDPGSKRQRPVGLHLLLARWRCARRPSQPITEPFLLSPGPSDSIRISRTSRERTIACAGSGRACSRVPWYSLFMRTIIVGTPRSLSAR